VLVGRVAELAAVDAALAAAGEGRGGLLAFIGEPGIGKSRLAEEASARARARGFGVLWGRTWEGAGVPPGWPWTQVVRELVEEGIPLAPADGVDLAPLLPELEPSSLVGPAPADDVRFRTLDALARLLRRAARATPRLLVLDDLHAADRLTLLALQVVARSLRDIPLMLIATQREAEARLQPEVRSLLEPILREGDRLLLGRLSETDVAAMLDRHGPPVAAASARTIHRLTEGNPLYVQEMARLINSGRADPAAAAAALPQGIRAVLAGHVELLSPPHRPLLATAALLGRAFGKQDLAAVSGVDDDRIETALTEAIDAGVVAPARGGLAFTHALLAEALVATLPPRERMQLHARIAAWWRTRPGGDGNLSEIAHHLLEAGGDAAEAIGLARRAAEQAIGRLAFDRAADLYARALARAEGLPDGERVAIELVIGRSEALGRSGDADAALALSQEAARRSRAVGASDLEARAALASATQFNFFAPDPTIVFLLEQALQSLPPAHQELRARLLGALAYTSFPSPSPSRTVDLAREALAIARRLGDPHVLLSVLHDSLPAAIGLSARAGEREALGRELAALGQALDVGPARIRGVTTELVGRLERGEPVDVEGRLGALDRQLGASGPSQERSVMWLFRGMYARAQGRFDEASACVEESIHVGVPEDAPRHRVLHSWAQAYTRGNQADLEAARALGEITLPAGGTTWLLAALGETEEARRRLRVTRPSGDFAWPAMIVALADACVLAEDAVAAEVLYPLLVPAAGEMLVFGPVVAMGPVDRILAGLSLLRGDRQAARAHHERALEMSERAGAMPLHARVLAEYGRFLAGEDPARSARLLARARELAVMLGMERLAASLADTLAGVAPAGARAAPPPPELTLHRQGSDWVLSRGTVRVHLKESKGLRYLEQLVQAPHREIHVLELVAGGATAETGDAGPVIDATARRQYERRLADLEEELREAEAFDDRPRASRAQREIDALAEELARATGLGRRERRAGSLTERARINVQRRLSDVITRVHTADPALARYLEATVKTGTFCSYAPLDSPTRGS
jgi:tetratricopeptide (TPR) repeat protein